MSKLRMIALVAAGAVAACAPYGSSPNVQQVQARNPTVSYNYGNDNDLNQARLNANAFCGQFQAQAMTPTLVTVGGQKTATFECAHVPPVAANTTVVVPPAPAPVVMPMTPASMTYTY